MIIWNDDTLRIEFRIVSEVEVDYSEFRKLVAQQK